MKVLFIDDEELVIQGLRRSMLFAPDDWDIDYALGGHEAMKKVARESYDAVVSDLLMPGVNGTAILERVRDLMPHSLRVILSGYADAELSVKALDIAHHFLMKPSSADELIDIISSHAIDRSNREQVILSSLVREVSQIPSCPLSRAEIQRYCFQGGSLEELVDICSQEPGLIATVLRVANSPLFKPVDEITDVRSAVLRLGENTVKSLVLANVVYSSDICTKPGLLTLYRNQALHALELYRGLQGEDVDHCAAMAVMLADVGRLVLYTNQIYIEAAAATPSTDYHDELGAYLLRQWNIPEQIVEYVRFHHRPLEASADDINLSCLLKVHLSVCAATGESPDQEFIDAVPEGVQLQAVLANQHNQIH